MSDHSTAQLSRYLDDELTRRERDAIETHLRSCTECAATLVELRDVVERARRVSSDPPATDLWPGIAARLGERTPAVRAARGAAWRVERTWLNRRVSLSLSQLAAAAVVLIALSGVVAWLIQSETLNRTVAPPAPVAGRLPIARSPAIVLANFADPQFDAAVADLQRALQDGRGRLDPRTIDVLQKNLTAIDQAIAQARQALASDPANTYLNSHLADARRLKLELLREATTLVDLSS